MNLEQLRAKDYQFIKAICTINCAIEQTMGFGSIDELKTLKTYLIAQSNILAKEIFELEQLNEIDMGWDPNRDWDSKMLVQTYGGFPRKATVTIKSIETKKRSESVTREI